MMNLDLNNKKKPLISIIVPVYKVNNYLNRCVTRLMNQSYTNIEVILVDDGSPDDCASQCDEWMEKDDRISVIHKINGGLSDARNYGLKIADGEFISFIDSDDYISEDFYEALLSTALKHKSDIVECNVCKFFENGEYDEYHDDLDVNDYSASEGLSALIDEQIFHQHVWNKIYKRDVIRDVTFAVGKQHEDVFWTYQIFGQAERITKINKTMYFYLQRESSIMGQRYNLRRLDYLEGKWNRQLYIEKNHPELSQKAKLDLFGSCIYALQCVIKYMSGDEKRHAISVVREYKRKSHLTFKNIKDAQGGMKKYYYLAKINLYLCCKLRILKGIE